MTSIQQEFLKINSCINMPPVAGRKAAPEGPALWCITPPTESCPPLSGRCFDSMYNPGVCGCTPQANQGNCIGDVLYSTSPAPTPYCLLSYGTYDNVKKCVTDGNKWRFLKTAKERGSLLPANYLDEGSAVGQCCSPTDVAEKIGICPTVSPSNCIDSSNTCEYRFDNIRHQLVGAPRQPPPEPVPQPGGGGTGPSAPSGTTSSSKKLGTGAIIGIIIGIVFALFLIITYHKYRKSQRVQFDFETLF